MSASGLSHCRSRGMPWRAVCLIGALKVALVGSALVGADDDGKRAADDLPVSVPVRILSSAAAAQPSPVSDGPMLGQPPPPQPTLPGGKLPQYQMGHQARTFDELAQRDDPVLRLLLAVPAQPLLIEATITIDGKPFRALRAERAERLLEAAMNASAADAGDEQSQSAEEVTDNNANSDAAVTPDLGSDAGAGADSSSDGDDDVIDDQRKIAPSGEEEDDDDDVDDNDDDPETAPVTPPTVAPYTLAATADDAVRRYVSAAPAEVTADEVRWLLTNWVDGPGVLFLNENFQRIRAGERPVFDVLDRDRSGDVSAEELQRAVDSFRECDLNRDEIIDALELSTIANDPRRRARQSVVPGTLLTPLPDAESAAATYERLSRRYRQAMTAVEGPLDTSPVVPRFDANADGRFDADELQSLRDVEADIRLSVAFDTSRPESSTLTVTGLSKGFANGTPSTSPQAGSVSISVDGMTVAISAVQTADSDQISLGAVADGYPLLPHVDPNDDGRFTIRELRQLQDALQAFDRDHNGQLTADEVQAPVRVCIGLGPLVHGVLSGIRDGQQSSPAPTVTGPSWFARMDRNKDNDLTRSEFPGADEQYQALDADSDALISAQEALDFDASSSAPAADATAPAVETNSEQEI